MKKIFVFSLITIFFICCNEENKSETKKLNITDENLVKVNSLIENFYRDTLSTSVKLDNKEIISIDSVFEINSKDSIVEILNEYDSLSRKFDFYINLFSEKRYIFKGDNFNLKNDTIKLHNYLASLIDLENIIVDLNTKGGFYGWRVRYAYDAKDTSNNNSNICTDTFIINPDLNKIISFTSNDWEQDFVLEREIIELNINTIRRNLKYERLIRGIPISDE
jgi:hypothetical protein